MIRGNNIIPGFRPPVNKGKVRHDLGLDLKYSVEIEAGDFIYIEPGCPHKVFNIGDGPLVAVIARSAADEWDKIVDYPSEHRPSAAASVEKKSRGEGKQEG